MASFRGDILLPAPSWPSFYSQSRLAGKVPRVLQTEQDQGWKLTPETLEKAAKQAAPGWKLLILTNPGNPSGTCYSEQELQAISAVCRQRGVIVLSDEIYARLTFNRKHASMAKHFPEGTILTSGFSKWASVGGWRLGYAHFPSSLRPLFEAVRNAASHTYTNAPAPMQYGVAQVLKENAEELDLYMTNCVRILQAVSDYCHRELGTVGVRGCKSQAGYYFMPDFEVVRKGLSVRGLTTGDHMTEAMLEEANVALMASSAFLRPADELTCRLCFVCFDGSRALLALKDEPSKHLLSDEFLHKNCLPIVQGVQDLKKWVLKHQ
ncbi:aspartate aminotransferase [Procambarus clarkii]|uniref:aspartate aminotransferase n=1 Tax=Procambarus clarkii TaxID=6728 RepID=UPI003744A6F0